MKQNKWYLAHREERIKQVKLYNEAHREEINASKREKYRSGYYKHRDKTEEERIAYNARRRARYASDIEYREKAKARARAYSAK